jgi:photosystem II stability/assembly factor-like uncharacterized protein
MQKYSLRYIFICIYILLFTESYYSQTWEKVDMGNININYSNIVALDTLNVWAGGNGYPVSIIKTTDGGKSWIDISPKLDKVSRIYLFNNLHAFIGTFSGAIYGTIDGGKNWILRYYYTDSTTGMIDYLQFFNEKVGIALGDAPDSTKPVEVIKTYDGGLKWENINKNKMIGLGTYNYSPASFSDSLHGWASFWDNGPVYVYRTTDGGYNWEKLENSICRYSMQGLQFKDSSIGIICKYNEIYITYDCGNTFQLKYINGPGADKFRIWDVERTPNTDFLWAISGNNILFSSDFGNTWKEIFRDTSKYFVCGSFPTPTDGWIGSVKGELYRFRSKNPLSVYDTKDNKYDNGYNLMQSYPNPFNPSTSISYQIPKPINVRIKIYDTRGVEIKTLLDSYKQPGFYTLSWDGTDNSNRKVSSGIYFLTLTTTEYTKTIKMILNK